MGAYRVGGRVEGNFDELEPFGAMETFPPASPPVKACLKTRAEWHVPSRMLDAGPRRNAKDAKWPTLE